MKKEYLGDGLYITFDGFGWWITSENGVDVLNRIYLEPNVYEALKSYHDRTLDMYSQPPKGDTAQGGEGL